MQTMENISDLLFLIVFSALYKLAVKRVVTEEILKECKFHYTSASGYCRACQNSNVICIMNYLLKSLYEAPALFH